MKDSFHEQCYKHFNEKYKKSVKEINDKYANIYGEFYKLRNEVDLLKAQLRVLKNEFKQLNELMQK